MIFRSGTARGVPFFAFESLATRPDSCSRVVTRREAAIESALKNKLEAKKKAREAAAAAAQREIAEFTAHFMEAAQRCFELIDKDDSGTLTKEEIVVAVKSDKEVVDFLKTCGEPNLVALTQPARLSKALDMLDTSKDGEMDMDEWMAAIKRGLAKRLDELADERERRERAAAAADEEFSAEFLNMARKVLSPCPIVLLWCFVRRTLTPPPHIGLRHDRRGRRRDPVQG